MTGAHSYYFDRAIEARQRMTAELARVIAMAQASKHDASREAMHRALAFDQLSHEYAAVADAALPSMLQRQAE